MTYFDEKSSSRFVAAVSVMIAAVLMIGAILDLYFVKRPISKLGLTAGFTMLFAISVGTLTNARRAEMFGATAAYAAVLVVFVSGDPGN